MIVFDDNTKDIIVSEVEKNNKYLLDAGLSVQPIKIKTGWMLPESILSDKRFDFIKEKLQPILKTNTVIREVDKSEVELPSK